MKHIDFEEWLKEWHAKEYIGTDDDMPDAFDTWTSELDTEEIFWLADRAVHEGELRGMKHAADIAMAALKN